MDTQIELVHEVGLRELIARIERTRDLGLLERITRMWVVLNRIHGSLQLILSCHSTNSVHRLDDWRIYSNYDEIAEAA